MEDIRKRVEENCLRTCYIIKGNLEDLVQLHRYLNERGIENSIYAKIIYIPFSTN